MKATSIILAIACVLTLTLSPFVSAQTEGERKIHIIAKGETLGDIYLVIRKLCGASPKEIHEWNPWINKNWRILPKGKEIVYYIQPEVRDVLAEKSAQIISGQRQAAQDTSRVIQSSQYQTTRTIQDTGRAIQNGQQEVAAAVKDTEASLRRQVQKGSDNLLTRINQTENRIMKYFMIGGAVFALIMVIVIIILLRSLRGNNHNQIQVQAPPTVQPNVQSPVQESFPLKIKGQSYRYTPQRNDDDSMFISLYKGVLYEKAKDAAKASGGVLKKDEAVFRTELEAGRLVRI